MVYDLKISYGNTVTFFLEGGYLTVTGEILGKLSGFYFVWRRFRVTISRGRNLRWVTQVKELYFIF